MVDLADNIFAFPFRRLLVEFYSACLTCLINYKTTFKGGSKLVGARGKFSMEI
jgi:hypothetical protein